MRIRKERCCALVIDMQERLLPVMDTANRVEANVLKLVKGLQILGMPILVSEQYPKGLGNTVSSVKEALTGSETMVEKIAFSCCEEPTFIGALSKMGKKTVILCGIEAHICVLQTVLDLEENGYLPVVVEDCIGSRKPNDKAVALERMRKTGAVVTTLESILFELTGAAGSEQFKQISKLIK